MLRNRAVHACTCAGLAYRYTILRGTTLNRARMHFLIFFFSIQIPRKLDNWFLGKLSSPSRSIPGGCTTLPVPPASSARPLGGNVDVPTFWSSRFIVVVISPLPVPTCSLPIRHFKTMRSSATVRVANLHNYRTSPPIQSSGLKIDCGHHTTWVPSIVNRTLSENGHRTIVT